MQHDVTLDNFPFRGPLYIHKKSFRENILQKNHKHGSQAKYFNNKKTSKNTAPPQATISRPLQKVNSVRFEDPYNHINPMENHLFDTQEQYIEDDEV